MYFYLLAATLVILQVLDLVFTRKALDLGAKEANPVARWLLAKTGNVWIAGSVVKVPVTGLVIFSEALPLVFFSVVLMGWVLWNNAKVVKQLGGF